MDERVPLEQWQTRLARHDARLQRVIDTEAQIAFWQAQHQHALAALEDDALPCVAKNEGEAKRWVAHEVAAALNLAVSTAADRIALACRLVRELPETLKRLEAGQLSLRHTRALLDAAVDLRPDQLAAVEAAVLPDCVGMSVTTFAKHVDRAVHELHPTITEDRRTRAITERGVWLRDARNGTVNLAARGLDPVAGAMVMSHLNTLAEAMGAEDRTAAAAAAVAAAAAAVDNPDACSTIRTPDQCRADALLALPYANTGQAPRVVNTINVSVALSTLLDLDNQPADITAPGFAPATAISATQARLLGFHPDSTWRRLITDPIGQLIDYGRSVYRPPATLADHINARDRHCLFPNCHRQADHCDIDHHHDWALGGPTNEPNLGDVCPRDHQGKHKAGWKITRLPNGTTRWTSPTGRTHDRPPTTYPIDTTTTHDPDPDPDPPPF